MRPSRYFAGVHVNKVIQFLTYSDLLMLSGWGLVLPIIAVFVTDQVEGGTVEVAGFAATIYFLVKSITQIPVARYIDQRKGEADDYFVMILGSAMIAGAAFLYIFTDHIWELYGVQVLYGLGSGLSYPSWQAIFTRHIDRNEEALEWSLYYTAIDIGSALTAGIGGTIAYHMGYDSLFILVGVSSIIGTLFLTQITKQLWKADKRRANGRL